MPVVVEPDPTVLASLQARLPAGSQAVDTTDRMAAWLAQHPDEYVAVLGPGVDFFAAVEVCDQLRTTRPTVSVVLVLDKMDTAMLTQAIKAGARDVVPREEEDSLSAAVERAHQLWVALRGPQGAAQLGRVVTVFSPKGGVGKTTVAVNLALALNAGGARRVCLVDLDLAFGDVAITMQLVPHHSIEHAVGSEETLDQELLESLLTRHGDSLMVLAAPSHPDVRDRVSPLLVSRVLRTLRESFDHVVVDTAPSFDEQVLTALDETDECVVVATLDVPTLKNVKVALETLDTLAIAPGHRHLLLNRADDAVGITPEKVETILGMPVAARVATSMDIAASTNTGTPIVAGSPTHQSSAAFVALAAQLVGEDPSTAPATSPAPAARSRFRIRR